MCIQLVLLPRIGHTARSCKQTEVTEKPEHNIYICVFCAQLKFHTRMRCCVQDGVTESSYTERISKKQTDKSTDTHTHAENAIEIERTGDVSTEVSISHTYSFCKRHKAQRYKSLRQSGSLWLFRWHEVN